MKRILLALLLMAGFAASAQSYLMNNNNPVTTCAGVFTDSGNTTGPYGNSQNFTKTFTPATAGSAIRFEFTSFQLEDQADLLQIFDGPDVSAPLIGGYSGTTIPPLIMPTAANTSGAITFRFTSDGVVTNPGWVANVTCVTPCQLIQSVLTSTVPAAAADGVIKVCPGTPVTFNGDGTFSSSGAGATYVWDVEGEEFTGQSFTYTFANSGAFRVNLRITDANGCTNINLINQVVQVSVPPVATFNADVDEICNGNQLSVDAIIAPVPFNYECTPPVSGTTFLPDGSGQSYTSIITVDCFQSNQQITSANQLINVCLNMEHSYLGDLNIVLTSPNGSTVVLKAYPGGGGTWLGTAIDDDSNLNPGVGAQYCLSMSGTSTMVNGPTQPVLDPVLNNTGDQLVPGTYLPIGNFSAFVGSPLNGSWTITVTDNLGIDNGYIFEWGLEFDPALVPGDLSFANTIVSQGWLPDPAIVSQVGDTITVSPETSGTHCFTYAVTDDFGCVTEFVKCIEVLPALPLNDPQDLFRCEGQTFDLTEVIPTILGSQNAAAYNFAFHHTALDAQYIANQIITPETYTGLDGEIIYVSIEDLLSGSNCIEVREFTLHLTEKPEPSIEALPGIICQDQPLNAVLTGSLAELPYTFEYNINGGATQTISTVGTDLSVPVPLPTNVAGPVTITITRITDNTGCFNDTPVSATTEVLSLPESDIVLDTANPCAAEVTFQGLNGTAPYEFTFTLGTGAAESVSTVAGSDSVTFTVPSGTSGTLPVTIINVSDANCSNVQNVTESITFGTLPEATITPNTTSICQGSTPLQVTFAGSLGTAPYQFTYVINGGTPQVTDSNNPVITLDTSLATTFQIDLLEVSDANCVNVQNDQLILTVSPLPTAEATVSANQVCLDSAEPTVTFTGSLGTAPYTFDYSVNGGPVQQVVSAAGVSNVEFTATTSSVGTYQAELISVTDANGCFQAIGQVVSITIVSPPTIPAIAELHVCDDNNDGIGCFDLTATIASITGGDPNLTVSFHETEDDAINNANPIPGTTYCNPNPAQQQIFVNVYYTGAPDCAAQAPVQLFIDPRPVPLNPIPAYTLCDYTTPGDATEEFDLSTMNAAILNGQTGIDVTYYASQDDALVPQNPIGPLYTSGNNTIWVRLENAASGCFAVSSFQLIVNPLPSITPYGPVTLCSDGVSDTASFPLNEYSNFISGGVPGTAVSYHLTLALAQSGEDPLPSPYVTSDATIYVRLENVATNCEVTTELVLNVEDGPAITQPDPLSQCDPNNDGIATFNLTDAVAQITGGIAGMTVTFHETEFDAQNGVNPIAPATAYANIEAFEQTIHIRVTSDLTGCPSYATLTLIVKPTPEANENTDPLQECDTDGDAQAFFDLASAIPNILNGLDAAAHSVRFWPTAADAANGTNEIAGIDAYLSVSTTIFVTVSTLDADTPCTDTVELELIVNPLPIVPFSITPIITLCDQVTPDDQVEIFDLTSVIPLIVGSQTGLEVTFYRNQADALAGANAITTPAAFANETPAVQTIWITVTSVATGCQALTTMDIRVEPLPSPILPALDDPRTNLCDANQDGYAEFDLDALILDMQQGVPPAQMVITFHETQEDAENGANAVSSPYVNDVPFTDTIYIRALNTETGCQRVLALTLNVTPAPVIPATLTPSPLETCDTLGDDQDGIATFDLTVYESQILAAQTAPGSYTVEYFTSLAAAQDGTLPIINPAQYQGTTGEIWYNVVGSTNECFNTGSFLIQVNAPLDVPVSLGIWSACDDQPLASGILTLPWDLTNLPATLAIPNLPGDAVVTFYPSPALAQQGTGAIPAGDLTAFVNTSNAQTIGISIVTAQGCISYTTLTLKVLPPPTVVTLTQDQDLHECDTDATPGTEEFDLTVNEEFMANNDTDLVFSYYLTQEDAEVPVNPIAIPTQHTSATGSVWVRAERPSSSDVDGEFCHVIQELKLFVDELPLVIATPLTLPGCAAAGSPTAVFDLTGLNDQILLAPQDPANYTFTYYTDAALTSEISNPAAYTGTDLQDIWVVVSNIATDCNSVSAQLILDVQEAAVATQPEDPAAICADAASTDGTTHVFDLTLLDAEIIGTQDPVQFTIAYFATIEDAIDHINPIATPAAYEAATGSVFAVVTNTASAAPCRSAIIEIPLVVEPLLQVAIAGENILCVTYPDLTPIAPGTLLEVTGVANPADYTFEWYLDGAALGVTTPTYYAQAAGDYTVNVISNSLNCVSTTAVHTITLSSPPVALSPSYTVTDAFQDTQTITINVAGVNPADYQYAIDGGALQSSPVFTNVGLGEHTVRVVGYCDEITIGDVFIIDYPHYFTPNGDGIHDTWNISWPTTQASPKIYIFDRYGKLMKQIHAPGDGWDGTYNGQMMPSTDYWFQVKYTENGVEKEFKAHFAMKR